MVRTGRVGRNTVRSPPFLDVSRFNVSILSTNSPVLEGETLDVTAEITNDGEAGDEQEVSLNVAGSTRDSATVQLEAGDSTEVSLSWATVAGDAGDYTARVETEDDAATAPVSVSQSADTFGVSITDAPDSANAGTKAEVDALVYNHGGQSGTQTVELEVTKQ